MRNWNHFPFPTKYLQAKPSKVLNTFLKQIYFLKIEIQDFMYVYSWFTRTESLILNNSFLGSWTLTTAKVLEWNLTTVDFFVKSKQNIFSIQPQLKSLLLMKPKSIPKGWVLKGYWNVSIWKFQQFSDDKRIANVSFLFGNPYR